jgi:glycosyltransferase involved in cell wall biosynthesis
MSEMESISVVIPVFNGERYLAGAVQSVLAQEYPKMEIIVVDDGSTDQTARVLHSFEQIRYVYQPNQGAAAARNHGVRLSTGQWLAFLDADDLWTQNKVTIQAGILRSDPALDMAFGYVEQFFSPEHAEFLKDRIQFVQGPMPGYVPGAMLVRKESFLKVGFFNEGYKIGEFIDWYTRALDIGLQSRLVREVILKRRIHDANTGIRERDSRKDYLRVLKASLDRRRRNEKQEEKTGP